MVNELSSGSRIFVVHHRQYFHMHKDFVIHFLCIEFVREVYSVMGMLVVTLGQI